MKALTIKSAIYFLLLAFFFVGTAFSPEAETALHKGLTSPPAWEKLGIRKVNRNLDRDEIIVTRREGVFSKIKIKVRRSSINMRRCVIHFRNGQKQEVAIRKNIPTGGETRIIDIQGNRRIITKVVFWYDTKGLQDKAVVELWGRH